MGIKIKVVIPTIPGREFFLQHAKYLLSKQTRQPDEVFIISKDQGVTANYKEGMEKCGSGLMLCIEDDDWYREDYIETMENLWLDNGRPMILGLNSTVYYNIMANKYVVNNHPGLSSMMSMMINVAHMKKRIQWPQVNETYFDMYLWRLPNITKLSLPHPGGEFLNIGIKHGLTKTGGGGHNVDWKGFKITRKNQALKFLKDTVDTKSFNFYQKITKNKLPKTSGLRVEVKGKGKFLTIITRVMTGKRPTLFKQHQKSIAKLKDLHSVQQIFIYDDIGMGMHYANGLFERVKDLVKGKYVYLLDDDDFITDPNFVVNLKKAPKDSQIIYFKMIILNGAHNNTYPTVNVWKKIPIIAQIGGSCFAVENKLWKRNIYRFNEPRCGDFYFVDRAHREATNIHWIDKVMAETGRVSRGTPE